MSPQALTRADIARRALPAGRLQAVDEAQHCFEAFCQRYGLAPGEDAVLLHVTDLLNQGMSASTIQKRLDHLNTAARLAGQEPWTDRPPVRLLLRGLHQIKPRGGSPLSLPLYPELVEDVVDAIMAPTHDQLRWRAAILLANDTGASASALRSLHWEHLRMARGHSDIAWPGRAHRQTRVDDPSVHAALRELWCHSADHSGGVFAAASGSDPYEAIRRALDPLPAWDGSCKARDKLPPGPELDAAIAKSAGPTPQQLRDRALVLVASHAALRAQEAVALRDSHFTVSSRGLLIRVPGRRTDVGLRARPGSHDPVTAWVAWLSTKIGSGLDDPEQPAFPKISGNTATSERLGRNGLNYIIHGATRRAGLKDPYPFSSLRSGWIRAAVRSGMPAHEVAAGAGMVYLTGLMRHEHRENLLRDNVAGRLGL